MEKLNVLYEDNHVIVVLKPQNVPTQEDESKDLDMLTMVKDYIKEKYNKPGNVFVGLVHRLDRPTGGVMVFAKTSKAATRLSKQVKNKDMTKKYLAVTSKVPEKESGKLSNYLLKNPKTNTVAVVPQLTSGAKLAELEYKVLDSVGGRALVEVNLFTGRSHQIRVQFKHIGCALVGDAKYGVATPNKKLALWAYFLRFKHPVSGQILTFKVLPPTDETPWNMYNYNKLV